MRSDGRVEAYRMNAAKCLDSAQQTIDGRAKRVLVDMARAWLALADQGEKNRQTTTSVSPRRVESSG